jgi:hypothetical protein
VILILYVNLHLTVVMFVLLQRWSNAERLLAIDQLIETCEPTQVRHMMQVIEPQFQRDFISLLPKEVRTLHLLVNGLKLEIHITHSLSCPARAAIFP